MELFDLIVETEKPEQQKTTLELRHTCCMPPTSYEPTLEQKVASLLSFKNHN